MDRQARINSGIKSVNFLGWTYSKCVEVFQVSSSTLQRHVVGLIQKWDKEMMSKKEDDLILTTLLNFSHNGLPVSQDHLSEAVRFVINERPATGRLFTPKYIIIPSKRFLRNFRGRHSDRL